MSKFIGLVSAYAYAQSKGYTGTEEEFAILMAEYASVTETAVEAVRIATESAQSAAAASSDVNRAEATVTQQAAQVHDDAETSSESAATASEAKETAVDKALDSEAYALGTRDGEDVGSSDPAYHNNAKYYAESVGTSAQTATEAAQTATQKAGEAAQSASQAAESASSISASTAQIETNKQYIFAVKSSLNDGRTPIEKTVVWQDGYINTGGLIVTSTLSAFALVTMRAGETVSIGTKNSNITIIGRTEADSLAVGDTVTPILKTDSTGTYAEFEYTAPADCKLTLCVLRANYNLSFTGDIGLLDVIESEYIRKGELGFIKTETSPNLFDATKMSRGGIVNNSGERTTTNYYAVSDYIPVSAGDIIRATPFENPDTTFALYNSEKTWVTGTRFTQQAIDDYLQITIPSNIAFVTVNIRAENANRIVITKNYPYNSGYAGHVGTAFWYEDAMYKGSLYDKKIAYNGDSICETRLTSTTSYNGGAYAELIAEQTGCRYENRAKSGGILASTPGDGGSTPARCVVTDVVNMADDADLICFEGGINDYWRGVPLGDYSESDYSGTLDETTVCGSLESIFRQATAKWVGKPIVFVIVHKIKSTVYTAGSAGYTFAQAREKMIGICNKYAIPYYDAFAESGLNAYNDIQNTTFLTSNTTGNPDGCHPNESAYKRFYVPQLIALFESVMPRR